MATLTHKQTHGGKGDKDRVSNQEAFNKNFDLIFGKKESKAKDVPEVKEVKKVPSAWLHT